MVRVSACLCIQRRTAQQQDKQKEAKKHLEDDLGEEQVCGIACDCVCNCVIVWERGGGVMRAHHTCAIACGSYLWSGGELGS